MKRSKHRLPVVAVLMPDRVVSFDLAIACGVFGRTAPGEAARYRLHVCAETQTVRSDHFSIVAPCDLARVARASTVIVPGIDDYEAPVSPRIIKVLRAAAARGARIASICTGAFVLAAAGLLDGRRATTHWLATGALAARYPQITVNPDVLFVDEGQILTSAGAAAGMDLCLHMLRLDHGAAVAANAARLAVTPLAREGGQAQFITQPPPASSESLAPLLQWLDRNLHRPMTVEAMAERASASLRTFSRRFRQQLGTTPLQWLLAARVRKAQSLLETTNMPVERVATLAGFESAPAFRDRFNRTVGVSPSAYRRSFGAGVAPSRSGGSSLSSSSASATSSARGPRL
jgi:transcriptional regulator GlxA family with amidase domain